MSLWAALAGGFIGTLVLTTALRTASELGFTRLDLPFLLGTAFTGDRARAKSIGYLLHLAAGQLFALVYYAIFVATDTAGWLPGMLFGLLHGVVSATALVNVLIVAFMIFLIVRSVNRVAHKPEVAAGPTEVELLAEIRDELRRRP